MAENPSSELELVSTGVPGLDTILHGGLHRAGFYILQGNPGSGKTTLALQYLFTQAARGEAGVYISLTESQRDLMRVCRAHGWNLEQISVVDLTRTEANLSQENDYSVFHPSDVELGKTTQTILAEVERLGSRHVVFDGLSELRLLAERSLRYRHQMLALKSYFEDRGVTVLLLDDRTNVFGDVQPESLVGGNIVMERDRPDYGRERRRLYITKMRGADFRDGFHDYEIRKGGVVVYPRLVAAEHLDPFTRVLVSSGIPNLDKMMQGGLHSGTANMLLGPAGVGKSTIAMKYVAQRLSEGGRAAVYTFDEVLETLFERSEKLCHNGIRQYAASGALQIQQVNPAQLTAGAFADEVRRAVEEQGVEIVLIDSLNGYMSAMTDERFLAVHLHELFSYLNQRGVLTLLVLTQHGFVGPMTVDIDVSYIADAVLLFRYYELEGEIRQALSVFKRRTGGHERTLRELSIDQNGVRVGEPLKDFRGIMTGVPEYTGNVAGMTRAEPQP